MSWINGRISRCPECESAMSIGSESKIGKRSIITYYCACCDAIIRYEQIQDDEE